VAAAADLEAMASGTRLRLRWAYQGEPPIDDAEIARIRLDKEAAFERLARVVAGASPGPRARLTFESLQGLLHR